MDPTARGFRKDLEQSARVDHLVKMEGESVGRPGRPQERRILEDPNREPADLRFFAPADIRWAADGQGKELMTEAAPKDGDPPVKSIANQVDLCVDPAHAVQD
jgi:hypothetical protein